MYVNRMNINKIGGGLMTASNMLLFISVSILCSSDAPILSRIVVSCFMTLLGIIGVSIFLINKRNSKK